MQFSELVGLRNRGTLGAATSPLLKGGGSRLPDVFVLSIRRSAIFAGLHACWLACCSPGASAAAARRSRHWPLTPLLPQRRVTAAAEPQKAPAGDFILMDHFFGGFGASCSDPMMKLWPAFGAGQQAHQPFRTCVSPSPCTGVNRWADFSLGHPNSANRVRGS